jgi:uncharacterized protein (DUF1330 family)
MPLTLCVMLWPVPGNENVLIDYEDQVLNLLGAHDGRLTSRVRSIDESDGPFEVHTIEFASEAALDSYMADPTRLALSAQRDRAIARTQLLRVDRIV